MPSQKLTEKLEQLKEELENLGKAVQLIEQASKTANAAGLVISSFPSFLEDLDEKQANHLFKLQTKHKEVLSDLELQIQDLINSNFPDFLNSTKHEINNTFAEVFEKQSNYLLELQSQHQAILSELERHINELLSSSLPSFLNEAKLDLSTYFAEKIDKHTIQLQLVADNFREKTDSLEKTITAAATEIQSKSQLLADYIQQIEKLSASIHKYFDDIRQINFPDRLDKIDNQISAINIGTGNLQSSFNNLQSKIDKIPDQEGMSKLFERLATQLENKTNSIQNTLKSEIKTNRVVMAILATILTASILINFFT